MHRAGFWILSAFVPLVALISGCGEPEQPPPPPPLNLQVVPPSPDDADPYVPEDFRPYIAFVTNDNSYFWKAAEAGCNAAAEEFNADVAFGMPENSKPEEQQALYKEGRKGGIAAIAICPIDGEEQVPFVNQMFGLIEVLTVGVDAPKSKRQAYVGADHYAAGKQCGELMKAGLQGGPIVITASDLSDAKTRLRRQGVIDAILGRERDLAYYQSEDAEWDKPQGQLKGDSLSILGTIVDGGDAADGAAKLEKLLSKVDGLVAVVAVSDSGASVAVEKVSKAGKAETIKVFAFGHADETLQAVQDGLIEATIVEDAYQYGYASIEILRNLMALKRDALPEDGFREIPTQVVNKENVGQFWSDLKTRIDGA